MASRYRGPKRRQRLESKLRTAEIQRSAAEEREARELQLADWPFAEGEELLDVILRDSPIEGESVIACSVRSSGEVIQRARPAHLAYDEALRLADRASFGLYDKRRRVAA